jgi:uncharacterized protein (TIGR03435 family)
MTFADLSPLANHLWQSTLCVAVAWLLTLALRKNRAAVRFWIWFAASAKFLLPFSLFVSAGRHLTWRAAPAIAQSQLSFAMETLSQPFAVPAPTPLPAAVAAPAMNPLPAILLGVWLCGIAVGVVFWVRYWRQARRLLRASTPLNLGLPIRVMSTAARLKPGIVGIFRPVLLLPAGIAEHLTPAQFEAIIAHELRHAERRDNLTAAIHMLVETVFWFHPLVWWIKWRLIEERERACDEGVLGIGSEPQVYAESILKVCEFYLASPAPCAAGVTGGELKKRIEAIMTNRFRRKLSLGKKLLLALAAVLVTSVFFLGLCLGQSGTLFFEVASVKPAAPLSDADRNQRQVVADPGMIRYRYHTLRLLLQTAYDLPAAQISGPRWLDSDKYDIVAKIPAGATQEQVNLMLRNLLAERLGLAAHMEMREARAYEATVAKGGVKLKEPEKALPGATESSQPHLDKDGLPVLPPGLPRLFCVSVAGRGYVVARMEALHDLFRGLQLQLGRPIVDKTGVTGAYDFTLSYALDTAAPAASDAMVAASDPAPTLLGALEHQLGIRLESKKLPIGVLVVDRANRTPREN